MKKIYHYEEHIEEYIARMVSKYETQYVVDNTIPYCHSDVCPRCQTPFQQENGMILNIANINAFLMEDAVPAPLAIIYCLCDSCGKEFEQLRESQAQADPLAQKIEDFIKEKLSIPLKEDLTSGKEQKRISYKTENHLIERGSAYRKKGYTIDRIILDYHNESCFLCEEPFSFEQNQLRGIEGLNFFSDPIRKTSYAYGICKPCKEKVENKMLSKKNRELEEIHRLLDQAEDRIKNILYK